MGDEGGREVHWVGEALLPIADQALLQLIERQRGTGLPHRGGEGGAKGGAIGAGGDVAGAMGSVLHRIGEGQQFFLAAEGRGKQGGAPGAGEVGGRRTDQQQALLGIAVRAVAADPRVVVGVDAAAVGDVDRHQLTALAARADGHRTGGRGIGQLLGGVKRQAAAAELVAAGSIAGGATLGEEVAELRRTGEERLVKVPKVVCAVQRVAGGVERRGGPGGGAAIAAMHHGQVDAVVAAGQIVGMAQLGCGLHGGHHAFELAQPELHAQVEPGHHHGAAIELGGGASGVGDQGQQALQQQHAVAAWVLVAETKLAGEAFQKLFDRAGVPGLAHQIVHGRQGAELVAQGQTPAVVVNVAFRRWR